MKYGMDDKTREQIRGILIDFGRSVKDGYEPTSNALDRIAALWPKELTYLDIVQFNSWFLKYQRKYGYKPSFDSQRDFLRCITRRTNADTAEL